MARTPRNPGQIDPHEPRIMAPRMTARVRQFLADIANDVRGMYVRMAELSEGELSALSAGVQTERAVPFDDHIMRAVSEAAEQQCTIMMRHRTGYGSWVAAVELTEWDETRRHGRKERVLAWESCASREEAESAVRRLLAENAHHASAYHSVESIIFSELEWEDLALKSQDGPPP
jgi:hypothetical protein